MHNHQAYAKASIRDYFAGVYNAGIVRAQLYAVFMPMQSPSYGLILDIEYGTLPKTGLACHSGDAKI